MPHLTGAERKYLRGRAHGLKPVVRIGRGGLTDALLENLDGALASHELVKVKFAELTDCKRELSETIDQRLGSVMVGTIGHVAIFYRQARDPERRRIELPARARSG